MIYNGLNNTGEIDNVYLSKRLTFSGAPPLSFPSKGYDLEDFLISGNTVQDGTPTPDAPVDVVGCGARTKNLLDNQMSAEVNFRGVKYTKNTDGSVKVFGTASSQVSYCILMGDGAATNAINAFTTPIFKAGDTIKFVSSGLDLQIRYTDGTYRPDVSGIVTLDKDVGLVYIQVVNESINTTVYPMITLSTETDTDYEPYGYKIPPTVNGTEYPIYLGQVPTTRKTRKLVFKGTENWKEAPASTGYRFSIGVDDGVQSDTTVGIKSYCSHFQIVATGFTFTTTNSYTISADLYFVCRIDSSYTLETFKAFLAAQYANGTPVTLLYRLATEETGIVNEPLHKIGDYADTVSMSQSGITIPTTKGENILTVPTTVLPSSVSVTTPSVEVAEVYGDINYQKPIYYKKRTLIGVPPLNYKALSNPLSDYLISGNTTQNGVPSPEDPVGVVGVGVKTENLFDINSPATTFNCSVDVNDNALTQKNSGIYARSIWKVDNLVIGAGYVVSITANNPNSCSFRLNVMDSADNSTVASSDVYNDSRRISISFTATETTHIIRIYSNTLSTGSTSTITFTAIMMNAGSTAKPYVPYGYKLDISIGGSNLFGGELEKGVWNSVSALAQTTSEVFRSFKRNLPAGTYTLSFPNSVNIVRLIADGTLTQNLATDVNSYTVTTTTDGDIGFSFRLTTSSTTPWDNENVMLNLGSTPLPYEPYNRITTPIYLGEVLTTRKIRKWFLTGEEDWQISPTWSKANTEVFFFELWGIDTSGDTSTPWIYSDRFPAVSRNQMYENDIASVARTGSVAITFRVDKTIASTTAAWKAYLAENPTTIWYVLANAQTVTINEPLQKIGDYADTISMAQAGVTIPTVAGSNVLDMTSPVKPSSMSITGNIKPTGYGQLLDVNNVEIYDKNNIPVFITG